MLKSTLSQSVHCFLKETCLSSTPLLLALSGGPDSLYLFTCLLSYREKTAQSFHIAHVDHGWRSTSQEEARALEKLAQQYHVPFHLRTLNPSKLKGNLEAACRQERYKFFAELQQTYGFQAVLTGHHQDDQAETILKRLLEGAHWSCWGGLLQESTFNGMRVWRPLIHFTKKQISEALDQQIHQAVIDPTNTHLKFLRARMRQLMLPQLNEQFGKNISPNLVLVGEEAQELKAYFQYKLAPLLNGTLKGPWGVFIDLKEKLPAEALEIRFFIRLFCSEQQFFLSRSQIQQVTQALQQGKANCLFETGQGSLWVDRQRLFCLGKPNTFAPLVLKEDQEIQNNQWSIHVVRSTYDPKCVKKALKDGWTGKLVDFIPISSSYTVGFLEDCPYAVALRKKWSKQQVPAFLYSYFPVVWSADQVEGEFLLNKRETNWQQGQECLKITVLCKS
jgi:tRNA(Ile)-lysidine synthase